MFRPATTILMLGRRTLVRADFGGGSRPRLLNVWEQERPAHDDIASMVELALSLGGKSGRTTWVLDPNLWSQAIHPPVPLPSNLSASELARALAFEAESVSGSGALESVVGVRALPLEGNERGWWVTQVRNIELQMVEEVVVKHGSTLGGMLHPAGVPRSLTGAVEGATWERIEQWPDLTAVVRGGAKATVVRIVNGGARNAGRGIEFADDVVRRERLVPDVGIAVENGEGHETLEGPRAVEALLSAWAAQVATSWRDVPAVRPPKKPMGTALRVALAVACCLVAASACVGHWTLTRQHINDLKAKSANVRKPAEEMTLLTARAKEIEPKSAAIKKEIELLTRNVEAVEIQRKKLAVLLTALADHAPEDVLIQKIDIDPGSGDPVIRGLALKAGLVDAMARGIEPVVASLGWHVVGPHTRALKDRPDGGPWTFELPVRCVEPETPKQPTSGSSPGLQGAKP